jgi:hypothetical protein
LEVTDFDIQTQNYTMSAAPNEGNQQDDAIRVLSNDGLEVVIDSTVLYRVLLQMFNNFYWSELY